MRQVSEGFKENIHKLGREIDVKVTMDDVVYDEISEFLLYTDTEPFKASMNCCEITVVGNNQAEKGSVIRDVNVGVLVNDEFEYINYGDFIISEREYSNETDKTHFLCYDFMFKTMKVHQKNLVIQAIRAAGQDEQNVTVQTVFNIIAEFCELVLEMNDNDVIQLPNGDITFNYNKLNNCKTYRDILDALAITQGVNFCVQGNMLKFIEWNNTDESVTPDTAKKLKYAEEPIRFTSIDFYGNNSKKRRPVNAKKCATKIIGNPIIESLVDSDDNVGVDVVANRLLNKSFLPFETETIGYLYLDIGDIITLENTNGDRRQAVIFSRELEINQGVTESFKALVPETGAVAEEDTPIVFEEKDNTLSRTFYREDGKEITIKFGYLSGGTNGNYVIMLDDGEGEHPYCVSDEGIVEGTRFISKQPFVCDQIPIELWRGVQFMNASQSVDFKINDRNISLYDEECIPNGIVLVFSRYDNGAKEDNYFYKFIPRTHPDGKGVVCTMFTENFGGICNKYLYIHSHGITGKDSNTASGSVNGITYNNRAFVLRAVYGV